MALVGGNGLALAGDLAGPQDGPLVLLLHGGGQTRHSWSRATARLADEGYRVVNLDMRGHGDSEWDPDGDYSIVALAEDLRAVLARFDRPAALVGASLGGAAAFYTAGLLESRGIAAIVMVDLALRSAQQGADRIGSFMAAHAGGFATIEEAADAVAGYNPSRPRAGAEARLRKNLRRRDDGRYYWHWDPRLLEGGTRAALDQRFELLAAVSPAVTAPTLLVRGTDSDVVSDASVAEMKRHVPQTDILEVSGAGHMVVGDRNDAFNDGVLAFLKVHHPR
ncbi:MAG: alpha/beta hydrolase [Sphingomonas sp.]|nr:alpha/beta hydrolase [Sphingomonas sp.]